MSGMVCFKLCRLKDKDIKKFIVLTNKGGNKLKNREKGVELEDIKEDSLLNFTGLFHKCTTF
jgi:hypothetical protein